jgi:hypothetical protein
MEFWRKINHLLFDKTAAKKDMAEVEEILREVLGTYTPQENFTTALNRVLEERQKGSSFHRTPCFKQFLSRNRRRADYSADLFTIARHVLEDLPKIYGIKPSER